jgi:hypothetical protein
MKVVHTESINSGFLLIDGQYEHETFRFFYYSIEPQTISQEVIEEETVDFLTNFKLLANDEGDELIPGTLLNMTVFNGITSVEVTFTGGQLFAVITETQFETHPIYDNEDYEIYSGVPLIPTTSNGGYLLLMTDSVMEPVIITSITVCFSCDHEVDDYFYGDENNEQIEGPSGYGYKYEENDSIFLGTNPTEENNNFSDHPEDRWSGVGYHNYRIDYDEIEEEEVKNFGVTRFGLFSSNHFTIQTTAMIMPDLFYDEEEWFHISPVIHIADDKQDDFSPPCYIQTFIGNDNRDPTGDFDNTFQGRFFANYDYDLGEFLDPETTMVVGSADVTLKDAYEATPLPFFNIVIEVMGNNYSISINNFTIQLEENAFYEVYTGQEVRIESIYLFGVNYGDTDGNPLDMYSFGFTNPIIKKIEIS